MNVQGKFFTHWKVYAGALILAFGAAMLGPVNIPFKYGTISFSATIFCIITGAILGPDLLRVFTVDESKEAASNVLFALAPFMAKMGISAGANLPKLIEVGPALLLQEFGNLGTIVLSLPLAILLGLKREAIGACHSIDRDSNLGLITDLYGADSPETRGVFAVYVTGSVIGTVWISLLVSFISSLNFFNPLALGMACGVGSANMMSVGTSTLAEIYPALADDIVIMGGTSDMLTGVTGIYMATFIALPLTEYLFNKLEPLLGRKKQ